MPYADIVARRECSARSARKNWYKHKDCAATRYKENAAKISVRTKERRKKDPKKFYGYSLMYKYGISIKEYDDLLTKQEGRCKTCGRHESKLKKRLGVDHKHIAGYSDMPPTEKRKYVRGLLCDDCNKSLGIINDDQTVLTKWL